MLNKITGKGMNQSDLANLLDKMTGQVFLSAGQAMNADDTGPAITAIGSQTRVGLLFDQTTDEHVTFPWYPPKDLDVSKAFSIKAIWSSANTAGNIVAWAVNYLAAVTPEDLGVTGTAVIVLDTDSTTADAMMVSPAIAIPASVFATNQELFMIDFYRDANHASETLAADAALYGILIEYTPLPEVVV